MLIELQKRKCLHCGHTFTHALGGFVFIMMPPCPKCGSILTRKIGKLSPREPDK